MSEWAMKRFWTKTSVALVDGGFEVRLDGRPVRTPAKRSLSVPTKEMADQIAAEWDAQQDTVNPLAMPWTRSANAAIDKVATRRAEVTDHLKSYAETDLICYRADGPEALVQRQADAWDPLLTWVTEHMGARLTVTSGVMPVSQTASDIGRLAAKMRGMSVFQLTAFHDLVTLSGSYVLALAVTEGKEAAEGIWDLSRIDEAWQTEQWGDDEEAAEVANLKKSAFFHSVAFYRAA